jgi:hypothetical protein
MLFATVAAVNILNIAALTLLVTGIVVVLGRILAGLVVFGIGLFLANLALTSLPALAILRHRFWGRLPASLLLPGISHGTATDRDCQRHRQFSL